MKSKAKVAAVPKPAHKPRTRAEGSPQRFVGRPTDSIIEQRVAEIIFVLSNKPHVHKTELHKEFTIRWGVHWRTVDRIVVRARNDLLMRLNRSKEEWRSESISFYESILANPLSKVSEKIQARWRLDTMLGLDSAQKFEVTGARGGPIQLQVQAITDAELDRIIAADRQAQRNRIESPAIDVAVEKNGHPTGNGTNGSNGHA